MHVALLILVTISQPLLARTIVLRSPQADRKEYQAYVRSSPLWRFPSEYLLEQIPSSASRERLARFFAEAQLSYTEGSIPRALKNFKRVAEMAEMEHWTDEDRLVFLHTYLRLAQLEHAPAASEKWLRLAAALPVSASVDPSLFPPPILDKLRKDQAAIRPIKVDVGRFWPNFRFALIDGQRIDLKSTRTAFVPPGLVRLTLLSDVYRTATVQMRADQLANYEPSRQPWISGGCWNPRIHWPESGVLVKPFFSVQCSTTDAISIPPAAESTRTLFSDEPTPLIAQSTAKEPPFYQRKWFWIGLGAAVVTAAVVIQASSPVKQNLHPTVSEGF